MVEGLGVARTTMTPTMVMIDSVIQNSPSKSGPAVSRALSRNGGPRDTSTAFTVSDM
jgi:hypothetical protein